MDPFRNVITKERKYIYVFQNGGAPVRTWRCSPLSLCFIYLRTNGFWFNFHSFSFITPFRFYRSRSHWSSFRCFFRFRFRHFLLTKEYNCAKLFFKKIKFLSARIRLTFKRIRNVIKRTGYSPKHRYGVSDTPFGIDGHESKLYQHISHSGILIRDP
jgi:hypothetical protein